MKASVGKKIIIFYIFDTVLTLFDADLSVRNTEIKALRIQKEAIYFYIPKSVIGQNLYSIRKNEHVMIRATTDEEGKMKTV